MFKNSKKAATTLHDYRDNYVRARRKNSRGQNCSVPVDYVVHYIRERYYIVSISCVRYNLLDIPGEKREERVDIPRDLHLASFRHRCCVRS